MAHETNSYAKYGAKLFELLDYRKIIVEKKRIIVSTCVQNLFLAKIFLISAGIVFL
jgi:hypothetical protein